MNRSFHLFFIRFSSLGDIVLNSSLFPALKKRWGNKVRISFLTSSEFVDLYNEYPYIDEVISFSRKSPLSELFQTFKTHNDKYPVDLIVDMHGTLRSIMLRLRFFSIPRIYVDKRSFERSLLTWLRINILSWQNNNEGRLANKGELLLKRNYRDFSPVFDFLPLSKQDGKFIGFDDNEFINEQLSSCNLTFITENKSQKQKAILNNYGISKKFIIIVPSASFVEKRWHEENFEKLILKLLKEKEFDQYQFVLVAGPNDNFCRRYDYLSADNPNRFFNLQGKTSIEETLLLVKKSEFVVGNDTGIPHFAESVGTPAIIILGPTGEEFGFYPHLPNSKIICMDIWCRPCTTSGKGRCIRSERFCLTQISVERVYKEMQQMISTKENMEIVTQ